MSTFTVLKSKIQVQKINLIRSLDQLIFIYARVFKKLKSFSINTFKFKILWKFQFSPQGIYR